ncbi:Por secretion system C-terminal sorting domain-containing protein [Marinospirillum celere]|uniref:Por secretion system C-terminal sorting domain-containing protein n=1 Tax=Marinospirillum celere TaxID=1122252 RepID=A0A1I1J0Y7_9GAMM|nr:hypothetical protein [Marinospirillum celere]SFC42249.1 Por secretion system C-terminal sorting domain-containing protein [Marinospirillum celere]
MLKHFLFVFISLLFSGSLLATSIPDSFIKLEPGKTYQGQLSENEVVRFYFELEQQSNILLESRTPNRSNTVYPDATLFNLQGRTLTRDWSSGQGRNFKIERKLDPGVYVLRVEDGRGCGSLHGCPEIIKDFSLILEVTEVSPF